MKNTFTFLTAKRLQAQAVLILICAVFTGIKTASAQLNPFSAMYYQNQYLTNPAMAGLNDGFNVNLGIRQQWATTPGSPKTQVVTGDYNAGRNVGLGLLVSNDLTGLIRQTRALATYAYHVNLSGENQKLNFGISGGVTTRHINYNDVVGDPGDVEVDRFNNQNKAYLDGDFGVSYTSNNLTVQGAIPNLNHFFNRTEANLGLDRSIFFSAISYKFVLENVLDGSAVEPKIVYRKVDGFKDIVDVGVNFNVKGDKMYFYTMYHTSQSESFGFGANISPTVNLMLFYTTESSALKTYSNGDFEVGLKLHFSNNRGISFK